MRRRILDEARAEAEKIVQGANKKVESTIRTIREAQAEKEQTKEARAELQGFLGALAENRGKRDAYIDKKLQTVKDRKEREQARKRRRADGETLRQMEQEEAEARKLAAFRTAPLKVGEKVRIKDNGMVGEVAKVSTKAVSVVVGSVVTKLPLDRVERITANEFKAVAKAPDTRPRQVYDTAMTERKARFKLELDVRGERVNDALEIVMRYIDDAIMLGVPSVRILHGKGTGALREEIQKYVRTVPGVTSAGDEHVQFGGAGVTVVKFD
jgi:DNA mismatch repair protein MutS2